MKRLLSLFIVLLTTAFLVFSFSSCEEKTTLEQLIYLHENALDSAEYSKKIKEFETFSEQYTWEEEHNAEIAEIATELGLSLSDKDEIKNALTKEDVENFINIYSVEDLFVLFRVLDRYVDIVNKEPLMWCIELRQSEFINVFELEENAEGYYTNETDIIPVSREEIRKDKNSLVETYDVKYYGDFAIEDTLKYNVSVGKYGWYNGVFYDQPDTYYERYNKYLYYKGEKVANIYNNCPKYPDRYEDLTNLAIYAHIGKNTGELYFLYRNSNGVAELKNTIGVIG